MDKLVKYRELIKNYINLHASPQRTQGTTENHVIFDDDQGRYMLFRVGWFQDQRVRAVSLYVRLHNGKIWVEEDWTEDGIATELLAAGVPNEDIVLAFHHPEIRPLTEFAVA